MSRLTPLLHDRLTPTQRTLLEAITGGKRSAGREREEFLDAHGAMRGPFNAFLHRPDLGQTLQRLGEQLRFEGRLPGACRELAILVVAARYRACYEWWAHARIARSEGVADAVIDAIAAGAEPELTARDQRCVYAYAMELMSRGRVTEGTHQRAAGALGEAALVELVALLGYYSTISLILNAFEVAIPAGESTPFDQ